LSKRKSKTIITPPENSYSISWLLKRFIFQKRMIISLVNVLISENEL
jgi:hypothetical protein